VGITADREKLEVSAQEMKRRQLKKGRGWEGWRVKRTVLISLTNYLQNDEHLIAILQRLD
jgi:hypothetical protein